MNFDEVVKFLKKRLKEELPGANASELMKPKMDVGASFAIKHNSPTRESAVLLLFYEEDGIIRFPLIQRPQYEGIHGGQVGLPGGKRENYDKNLEETALREAKEEVGIDPNKVAVLGSLTKFFVMASNFNVLPVVGFIEEKPHFVPDQKEVEDIITPSLEDLIDPRVKKEKEMMVRNEVYMICPYFDLETKVVWGATAMILNELVEIMKNAYDANKMNVSS